MFTALAGATSDPAAGLWLITRPAGTVSLDALPIVPGNSPAPVMAASAADCVRFVTLGTVTSGGGPDEMTRLTLVPPDTFVLATGLWLITSPAATVVLDAVVIAPTLSPTDVICAVAALCVSPTVCGTVTPLETTRLTALPAAPGFRRRDSG